MVRADQRLGGGALRLFERLVVNRTDQPDFIWTPYPDFLSPLRQDALGGGVAASWTPAPHVLHEFRAGYGYNSIGWQRPFAEIPTLTAFNFSGSAPPSLPGSPLAYGYRDRERRWELGYTLTGIHGSHQWKAGADVTSRRDTGALTFGRDGRMVFPDVFNFYLDWPTEYDRAVDRTSAVSRTPDYEGHVGSRDAAFFVQDDWRVSPRLTVSAGARYEYFGSPELLGGTRMLEVDAGGAALPASLGAARLKTLTAGALRMRRTRRILAAAAGLAWRLGARGPVLRASYGVFYDRPYNNLWQSLRSNSTQLESFTLSGFPIHYVAPPSAWLGTSVGSRLDFPELLLYQPGIRTPYSQNFLFGLSSNVGDFWQWEVNHLGSLGRLLITTDQINRPEHFAECITGHDRISGQPRAHRISKG